jgi:TldD protein
VAGRCSLAGADARVVSGAAEQQRLSRRLIGAQRNAAQTVDAGAAPGGSAKLVIDYALAKGLAHEAFGHASESDGMVTSILGREGRMRLGETVAPPFVSIVDGPVAGDFAYQPISANGQARETVSLVRDGVLVAGLGDLFSAARAGMPISGADRIESYQHPPLPRMSNIRIELRDPLPLDRSFEEVKPEELRAALVAHGLIEPGERVLYLSGYRGGQVNPKLGDYVFNCAAIYDFTDGMRPCKPAIFSGLTLSTLRSIVAGLGPLHLDAMGFCGKSGQSVPSSGGSHAFVVVGANPDITIGGR